MMLSPRVLLRELAILLGIGLLLAAALWWAASLVGR